ncbi:MAG: hypothetical protein J7L04_03510 [Bacteroidales bacterium]|nr:hypothetical protein [Bacteroidales bacterium]
MRVEKDITIEELVETVPGSVKYLMNEGIKCIACGEPIWGTLEEAALEKGFNEKDIQVFVKELSKIAFEESQKPMKETENKIDIKNMDPE